MSRRQQTRSVVRHLLASVAGMLGLLSSLRHAQAQAVIGTFTLTDSSDIVLTILSYALDFSGAQPSLTITKPIDRETQTLEQAAAQGKAFRTANLAVTGQFDITYQSVLVTTVTFGGPMGTLEMDTFTAISATPQTRNAMLSGAQEVPANTSPASGTCTATVNPGTGSITFSGTYAGLGVNKAISVAIHGPAAPGAVAPVILNATSVVHGSSGTFSGSASLTATEVTALLAGQAYCQLDDTAFPSGEIRGQLVATASTPVAVPAFSPAALAVLGFALGGTGALVVKKRGGLRRTSK